MDQPILFDLGLPPFAASLAKQLLGLSRAEAKYAILRDSWVKEEDPASFCRRALALLDVPIVLPQEDLFALRKIEGPVFFVSNHPFGAIDALFMMTLMGEVRPDFKLIGNAILEVFPELVPALLPVHIMGKHAHPSANIPRLRSVLRHLYRDGAVGLFPAGQVAAFDRWKSPDLVELPWNEHLGRLVKKTRATVIPLFLEGRNSLLFQYLGLALPGLRIALLAREMLNYQRPVRFKIGKPILFSDLHSPEDAKSITLELRRRTFDLKAAIA